MRKKEFEMGRGHVHGPAFTMWEEMEQPTSYHFYKERKGNAIMQGNKQVEKEGEKGVAMGTLLNFTE